LTNLSEFGEEDEDVKPNVEYLDSLNEYRKRSRSLENSDGDRGPSKTPKLNGYSQPNGFTPPALDPEPPAMAEEESAAEEPQDDPIVHGKFSDLCAAALLIEL
jgi:transcription initiation factor TFIIE subunit alpha